MPLNESSVLVRLKLLGGARFAGEARGATASLAAMKAESTGLAGRLGGLKSRIGGAGAALARGGKIIGGFGLAAAAVAGEATHMAIDFQQAMEMIHTQAGASQKEVDSLRGSVLGLAKSMPQSPQQLAEGLFHLESIGLRGAKAMDALKVAAQGAMVGNANLEDTSSALGAAWLTNIKGAGTLKHTMALLNATVGAGNMRMGALVDALGTGILPAAKTAGLGIGDVMGALAVFTDEGYQASSATAQMGTALHFLYNPTAKASTALNSIGLSSDSLAKDMHKPKGLLTALRDLHDHLGRLKGGARGIAAEQTLGQILPGGRGRIMLTLLNQLDRYQMKMKQIAGTTGRFGEAVRKSHELAVNKIKSAWSSLQAALINIGGQLIPAVTPALTGLLNGLAGLLGKIRDVGHALAPLRNAFAAGFSAKNTALVQGYTGWLGKAAKAGAVLGKVTQHAGAGFKAGFHAKNATAVQGFTGGAGVAAKAGLLLHKGLQLVGPALKAVGRYAAQFLDALKPAAPFFSNVLLPLLKGVAIGLIGGVLFAFKMLIPIVKIVANVLGFLGKLLAPFKGVFEAVGVAIGFLAGDPILGLLSGLGKVGKVFSLMRVPVRLVNGAFRVVGGVVGRLVGVFDRAFTWFQRFVGTFSSAPARLLRAALNIVGGIMHGMGALPGRMARLWLSAVERIIGTYATVYKKIGTFAFKIGKGIIHGIVAAIKAAPGAIAGAVSSIIPGPIKWALKKAGGFAGSIVGALQSGGVVRTPLQVVGERGPELAALPMGTRVSSAADTRSMMRSGRAALAGGGVYEFHLHTHLSGKQIHHEVVRVERAALEAS